MVVPSAGKDNETLEQDARNESLRYHEPTSQHRYVFLVRLSRRMGTVATRSFMELRDFLQREIVVNPPDSRTAGIPRVTLQRPASKSETTVNDEEPKLEEVVRRSSEVLARANTVFPLTIFPDTVVVDRTKVTIIRRDFFWSSDTISFRIEDVLNVSATVGPFFGSLTIASRVMSTTDHFQIRHLWRSDAVRLKHLIQGYVIAQHNRIDIAELPREELIETLTSLGHE